MMAAIKNQYARILPSERDLLLNAALPYFSEIDGICCAPDNGVNCDIDTVFAEIEAEGEMCIWCGCAPDEGIACECDERPIILYVWLVSVIFIINQN